MLWLDAAEVVITVNEMSVSEIQRSMEGASREEKLTLLAWLRHDLRKGSASHAEDLSEAHREIDRGEGVRLEEFKRRSAELDEGSA